MNAAQAEPEVITVDHGNQFFSLQFTGCCEAETVPARACLLVADNAVAIKPKGQSSIAQLAEKGCACP